VITQQIKPSRILKFVCPRVKEQMVAAILFIVCFIIGIFVGLKIKKFHKFLCQRQEAKMKRKNALIYTLIQKRALIRKAEMIRDRKSRP